MGKIEIQSAKKVYGSNIHALIDVNLEVNDKEFLVLLGPSGCGKTTLLRCIAGLESLTSGEILIEGKVVTNSKPKTRNVAMVFQNYALYPHMSVYDNMAFALKGTLSNREIQQRINEVSETLDIVELLKRKPPTLSGGQCQRVALGRAMVRKPNIFLLDEPLSNLDAQIRAKTRIELRRLHRDIDATFIYVTHDQEEAMTMGTKITIMSNGTIQQIGLPLEIYNSPKNIFVARFIGVPQINLFNLNIYIDSENVYIKNNTIQYHLTNTNICNFFKAHPKLDSIIVGIRLEYIPIVKPDFGIKENIFIGKVNEIVRLGRESLVYISHEDISIVSHVPPDSVLELGDDIYFTFEEEHLLFFDDSTNERLEIIP